MTNSVSEPAFRSISGCATYAHSHIIFRIINALKDFESPSVCPGGAASPPVTMYTHDKTCTRWTIGIPNAALLKSNGSRTELDGANTSDQSGEHGAQEHGRTSKRSALTCRFVFKNRPALCRTREAIFPQSSPSTQQTPFPRPTRCWWNW